MLVSLTSKIVNQVIVPGSLFWKREKRVLIRRWKRAMLLPETVLLAGLIVMSGALIDTSFYRPGQQALASHNAGAVVQDGVPAVTSKRQQRLLQDRLQTQPDNLMTLTGDDVVAAFSYADLQRREGEMLILQFRGRECVLDIYFEQGGHQTTHYEFRPRQVAAMNHDHHAQKINPRHCVNDIVKSRRA